MKPIESKVTAAVALLLVAIVVVAITVLHRSPALRGSAATSSTASASASPFVTPTPSGQPAARIGGTLFYDGFQLVLFGGASIDGQTIYNDVWAYRGGWQLLSPSSAPPPMSAAAAAYDSLRGVVILFGASGPH